MFTGIIDNQGTVTKLLKSDSELELEITLAKPYGDLKLGDSVACDGMCVTVTEVLQQGFRCYLSAESLAKTISGDYKIGFLINLERPLALGGRLDGHYVTGHVDGVTELSKVEKVGQSHKLTFLVPQNNSRFFVEKGAVTINGTSLTVNEVNDNKFAINIIPHTYEVTNFSNLKEKSKVNYEVDILAKYFLGNRYE